MAIDQLQNDSVDKSRQQLGYSQQLEQSLDNQKNIAQQLNQIYSQNNDAFKLFAETIRKTKDEALELKEAIKNQLEALKETNEFSSKYAELNEKIKKAGRDFEDSRKKSVSLESNLGGQAQKLAQQYVDGLTARYKIDEKINELAEKRLEYEEAKKLGNVNDIENARKEYIQAGLVVDQLKEQMEVVNQINSGQGIYLNNLSKEEIAQLQTFALLQKQMDISRNIVRNHQDELNVLDNSLGFWEKKISYLMFYWSKFKEFPGISGALNFISTQLKDIGIDFKSILTNVLKLDSLLVNFGKSVQVSKEGARILADSFNNIADKASSFNNNVSAAQASVKNQIEANNALNESLGTGALFTAKTRIDQIELVKGMGLQAETGAKIYQLGKLNNMTAHETAVAIGDQVVNFRKQTGVTLDYRKVLTDVAKISGQLAVQYKNNPELIAKAVIQAKELGITLEQAARMSDKLLDFPGSIENELKAELLTGKALNLEQARYYALMGDSAKAAKELMNNVGGLEEFQKLNVLQQRALAEAVGMTADELSNSLTQQELLKGTAYESKEAFAEAAKEAARTGDYTKLNAEIAQSANGEQLAADAARIGNQEKFQMAIEKLQESVAMFVNGPLGKMIDKLAIMTNQAGFLKSIFTAIAVIISVKMISGLMSVGKGIVSLIGPIAKFAKTASLGASALSFGIGLAASLAAYAIASSMIDSIVGGEASVGGGGGGGGVTEVNTGAINTPKGSNRPIVVEVKNENKFTMNNRDIAYQNTSTQQTVNTKVDRTS